MTVYKYLWKSFLRNKLIFVLWLGIFALITLGTAGFPEKEHAAPKKQLLKIALSEELTSPAILEFQDAFKEEVSFTKLSNDEISAREAVFLDGVDLAVIKDDKSGDFLTFSNPVNEKGFLARTSLNSFLNFLEITWDAGEESLAKRISELKIDSVLLKREAKHNALETWYYFVFRFLGYPLMAVVMSIIGNGILSFHSEEITERSKIASLSRFQIKWQSFLAELTCTLFILALSVGIVLAMGGIDSVVPYAAYILNTLSLSLASLGMIFMLTHFSTNKYFIGPAASFIPLSLSFLSGLFVPAEFLPSLALNISKFFPLYYYVKANELARDGISVAYFQFLAVEIAFTLFFFFLAVLKDRISSKRAYT